ncbi:MAG: class I SAM-dependent methyltransferase [Candidatus Levybacteria bacterium]|nr:class I SAM-dependent methyltransferase [Candidatus Levybacteria bacterium]
MKSFKSLDQYRRDIFTKMNLPLKRGGKILDVGCGDGDDCKVFIDNFKLKTYGIDVYRSEKIRDVNELNFKKGSIYEIPFGDNFFDYVFLQNVLHHVDEPKQRNKRHVEALKELKRVCKRGGLIMILEGNRYNPLFYPHMVRMEKHDHFKQSYFYKIIGQVFQRYEIKHFEGHVYPASLIKLFKVYDWVMDNFSPKQFKAYNLAIIENEK